MDSVDEYIKLSVIGLDVINKTIFIIIGIRRLFKIQKDMNIDKKYLLYSSSSMENPQFQKVNKQKWTFHSMSKFILNKLIVLLYIALIIINFISFDSNEDNKEYDKEDDKEDDNDKGNEIITDEYETLCFCIYCSVSCITWLISTRVFYKEFRVYKDQTFSGIRIFWIINNIINIILIILIYLKDSFDGTENKKLIISILFGVICLLSCILSLFAFFHPYDVSIEKNIKDEEDKNIDDGNVTRISTGLQDDLLFNSEDEFGNEEEISFHNMEALTIELNDSEGFNVKQYNIELKLRTQDFKQIIFSIKIDKIKHRRVKMPINVSNFNEVVLKYYKNRNISKELLNLIKQAYNISLTLNPQRNSFTGDKKNLNLLAHLYREIIKKYNQFLLDLLKFLKIKTDNLINSLQENFKSIYDENPSVEQEIERVDSLGSIFDNFNDLGFTDINNSGEEKLPKTDRKLPKKDFKIKENDENLPSINSARNATKRISLSKNSAGFSTFLNNILINKRFVNINIISYEEISQNINFILKTAVDKNEIILQLNIDIMHDILYDDELTSYIIDNAENLNDKKLNCKKILEELFNAYLNNVFYYDEKLYNLFNINELLKLENEKYNNDLIQKFFEEKKTNLGAVKNDIREYLFEIKIKTYNNNDIKILINEGNMQIDLTKTNIVEKLTDKNKDISCKINIVKFYLIIEKMASILNKTIKKYNELEGTLNNILNICGKLMNIIYNIPENQIKNIKNYRIKEVLYGEQKINALVSEFEKRFSSSKIQIDKINQEKINDINKEIQNLNAPLNSILNKSNLKYALYFTCFRDLIEFSSLF